jgi:hypothetical protein
VAGPSWLAGPLAAVMIVIAVYCAGRLVVARQWGRETEFDADGTHAAMGVAMAGMLVPRLSPVPVVMWQAVFAGAAGWFVWQAFRRRIGRRGGRWLSPYPVPHLVECAAMLYMLLAVPGSRAGGTGMPMPGMGGSPGAGAGFPAVAVVLALFIVGYVTGAADQLTSLARTAAAGTAPAAGPDPSRTPRTLATVAGAGPPGTAAARTRSAPATTWRQPPEASTRHQAPPAARMLAPRLAACYKIVMGITMGYMLIVML